MLQVNQLHGFGAARGGKRWWRLYITAGGGDEFLNIMEIEYKSGGVIVSPSNMTSENTPGGHVITESSAFSSSFKGHEAFDGTVDTATASSEWATADTSMPQWVLWRSPVHVEPDEIKIYNKDHGGGRGPEDFKVQYSRDGVNFTDAKSVTGETGWSGNENRSYTW